MDNITLSEKIYSTSCGDIHYYLSPRDNNRITLVFLPGLTADYRLFEKQYEYFADKFNIFAWNAPCHKNSWPFSFDFKLKDKAIWLHDILTIENINNPIIVGQSMGGYVAQQYTELFPNEISGFISIDSSPIKREYTSKFEIFLLKHADFLYSFYSWKSLLKWGSKGVSTTKYGQELMYEMMSYYNDNPKRYYNIAAHGYRMVADAFEADKEYKFKCPVLLLCGDKDYAGSSKRYNIIWHKKEGYALKWIENAGHNSNTDRPDLVNLEIETFCKSITI